MSDRGLTEAAATLAHAGFRGYTIDELAVASLAALDALPKTMPMPVQVLVLSAALSALLGPQEASDPTIVTALRRATRAFIAPFTKLFTAVPRPS